MSTDPRSLRIADYTYELPDDRIARYPLAERDAAKLLVYNNGTIESDTFHYLGRHLPEGSTLVLNTAKVVRARLIFQKPSGGTIEIFCLEPHAQYTDIATAMARTGEVYWQCLVGGAAKWKPETELELRVDGIDLRARKVSRNNSDFTIHFRWTPEEHSFAEVLAELGKMPLPPYIHREADESDESRYQTLFAQHEGSVAAPTASLHFTPGLLESLRAMSIHTTGVTLHVGAGTFMPVKSEHAGDHHMHSEWIEVRKATVEQLLQADDSLPMVAGGTTALRTLESLYWIGAKIFNRPDITQEELAVQQWEPYDAPSLLTKEAVLDALNRWMERNGREKLISRTGLFIAPGYQFRMADALITNFHQPQSTLLLLVAAFIGPGWRKVYDYALQHDFRFLSYGDGSLLWRRN